MSRRRHPFVPVVGWALVVGLASVTPPAVLGGQPTGGGSLLGLVPLDLTLHLLGYGILAALLVRATVAVRPLPSARTARALLLAVATATIFGLCIEGVQALITYRDASLLDASVNLLGAVLGAGLMMASARHPRKWLG